MSEIIEAGDLPENEKVYLKKGLFGWRVVYPIKDENGKLNYLNFITGGWQNLLKLIFIILVVLFFIYIYHHDLSNLQEVAANPCLYCRTNLSYSSNLRLIPDINLSIEVIKNEENTT